MGGGGLRRVVFAGAGAAFLLLVGLSALALMAVPVVNGETELGGRYLEAPVLGIVSGFQPAVTADVFSYAVAAVAAAVLFQAANGQMLGLARLSYSLGDEPADPERRGPARTSATPRPTSRSGPRR